MAELNAYWFEGKSSAEVARMVARAAALVGIEKVQALLPAPLTVVVQQGDVESVAIILAADGKQQIPAWQGNTGASRSSDMGLKKEVEFVAPLLQKFFEATRDLLAAGSKEAEEKTDAQKATAQADRAVDVEYYRTQVEAASADAKEATADTQPGDSGIMGTKAAVDVEHDPA